MYNDNLEVLSFDKSNEVTLHIDLSANIINGRKTVN